MGQFTECPSDPSAISVTLSAHHLRRTFPASQKYSRSFRIARSASLPVSSEDPTAMRRLTVRNHHGDLINGLCYTIFVPVYGYIGWVQPGPGCVSVNFWFNVCALSCWASYFTNSVVASLLACLSMAASIMCMNLFQWPIVGEVVVFPQFLWMLLIISGNVSLSFRYKLVMGAVALLTAVIVSVLSPLVEWTENMPLLLGLSAAFALFHYYTEMQQDESPSARTASIVLAGALAYHFTSQMNKMRTIPGYTVEGGYSILQAGFFASVGLAAAGAFQKQLHMTDTLEGIVAERKREIVQQARDLHMVGLAVHASETAISIVNVRQQVEWCNAALERMFPTQKVIGRPLLELLASTDEHLRAVKAAFESDSPTSTEVLVDDDFYSIEVSPIPQMEASAHVVKAETEHLLAPSHSTRFLVVLKNVTTQRAREQAEKHAQKEALHKQAMQESMEVLSHELRTPLQGIMGMTSLLLDSEDLTVAEAKEAMSMVMVSSRLLLTLINNLLDVRKCDAKLMNEFQLSSVPLSESMKDAANFCRPLGTVTNVSIDLSIDPSGEDVLVRMNPIRFQQVVINLVSNAIKYTRPNSTVKIEADVMPMRDVKSLLDRALTCGLSPKEATPIPDDELVAVVSVKDSGTGINTSTMNQVFAKFSQGLAREKQPNVVGKNRVAQPTGTGLGLNLCLKFVKRMNGNIWVSENPEGGACFSFYLPCSDQFSDVENADGAWHENGFDYPSERSVHHNGTASPPAMKDAIAECRVLVVDDTAINLKVLERMLRRIGIEYVHCVESGTKALQVLEKEEFDLVLTDIQMPEMSGIELCEAVHQRNDLSCMPSVIGLVSTVWINKGWSVLIRSFNSQPHSIYQTAETSDGIHKKSSDAGMLRLLHKPITSSELSSFFSDLLVGNIKKDTSAFVE